MVSGIQARLQRRQKERVFCGRAYGHPQTILQQSMHFTDIFHQYLLRQQPIEDLSAAQTRPLNAQQNEIGGQLF